MSVAHGRAVLAVDELLCSPERSWIVAELRRLLPTGCNSCRYWPDPLDELAGVP